MIFRRCYLLNLLTLLVGLSPFLFAQSSAIPGAVPNPYRTITDVIKMPAGRQLGGVLGIDIDRDGKSLWVFEKCGAATCVGSTVDPILKFSESGQLLASFGAGLFANPHGLYVDRQGNIWAIEGIGGRTSPPPPPGIGHQVLKFSPTGKLLLKLGTGGVAGEGPDTFNTPSDVLVAPNGDIFVADGHGGNTNARVVKFDKNGRFLKTWGRKGTAPGEFDNAHTLAMDSRGRLFVGDRSNLRIQLFDQNGTFLEEWKQFGAPSEVFINQQDVMYVADTVSTEKNNPGFRKGIRIGSAKTGQVTAFIPDPDPNTSQELVVADARDNIYGGLTVGNAIRKYVREN